MLYWRDRNIADAARPQVLAPRVVGAHAHEEKRSEEAELAHRVGERVVRDQLVEFGVAADADPEQRMSLEHLQAFRR